MRIPIGFAQVAHDFGGNGLAFPAAVVYGVDISGSLTPSEMAESLHIAFGAEILEVVNESVQLERTRVKYGPQDLGPFGEFSDTIVGGTPGAGSPSNCAFLITKSTGLGGRKGRGRMYLPGCTESQVGSDGALDAGQQALLQTAMTNWQGALTFVGQPLVLLHNDETSPTPVTSLSVQGVIATQRRRMRR